MDYTFVIHHERCIMNNIQRIRRFIHDSDYRFIVLAERGFYKNMQDEEFIKRMYKAKFGRELNLTCPQKYTEKLQWLKLHDHRKEYITMVDKYEVKKYVANVIGEEYVIPTLGIWERFQDIDFSLLPNRFVLKTTHDSGGIVICKDKDLFDIKKAKRIIEKSLRNNFYAIYREWPYKSVKPRIIAEAYMEDQETEELRDYKFFCFDGRVEALFIASDRQKTTEETKFDFFDSSFQHLSLKNGHPNAACVPEKPKMFNEMKAISEKLAKGIPHVRVDLYEVNGKIYFGELTFFHWGGFMPFEPEKWDDIFGAWLSIDNIHQNDFFYDKNERQ